MGFMNSVIPAASLNLDSYLRRPLGSAGEAFLWLSALVAQGSGTVGYVRFETATVSALKRAALKLDGISFETPTYSADKDSDGKRVKLTDPPAASRMGATFKRHHDSRELSVFIDRLTADESIPAESRELVSVVVL